MSIFCGSFFVIGDILRVTHAVKTNVPDIGLQFMGIGSIREKLEIINFENWTESEKKR